MTNDAAARDSASSGDETAGPDRDRLRTQLKRHEGLRLHPYRDSVGVLTIGYGRNLEATGINEDEAEYLLSHDIDRAVRGLLARYAWFGALDPVRQAVLVNMAFNLGLSSLAGFTGTLAAVASGDYETAAAHMLASKWAAQVGGRARELAVQMRTGQWWTAVVSSLSVGGDVPGGGAA
jgi:lysozyme